MQTSPLYRLNNRSSIFINDNLWMKSTNVHVLFWVRKASTNIIIHPFRKAQSQKDDRNVKQATLKVPVWWKLTSFFPHFLAQNSQFDRKTLFDVKKIEYNDSSGRKKLSKFLSRGRHISQSECVWILSQHKNGSDLHVPLSLHAKYTLNPASLQTSCKSLIQNQSSALPGYPSLFLTIILKWAINASSARFSKLHITPHKMTSLYRHSLGTLF